MYKNLCDIFMKTVEMNLEKIAFCFIDRKITYRNLYENTLGCEKELCRIGVKEGTKVLVKITEPDVFSCILFAIWKLHAIIIPIEKKVAGTELIRAKEESKCDFYITTDADRYFVDNLSVEEDGSNPGSAMSDQSGDVHRMKNGLEYIFYEKMSYESNESCTEETALMFYTSGTTGLPKCVFFTHDAMTSNIMSVAKKIKLSAMDIFYTPLVLTLPATITTVLLPALCSGATLLVSDIQLPRGVLKNISIHSVTVFFAVPYMYELLIQIMDTGKDNAFQRVKECITSSAFMRPSVIEHFYEKTNLFIRSIYCSSEAGAITYNDADDLEKIKFSVGRPLPGVQIKIGENAQDVGEIIVSGINMSKGYFSRPELQKEVFLENGVKTGDLGHRDQNGFLFLQGRLSDTINVAGYLVNPQEVEELIVTMDGIAEAVVYAEKKDVIGDWIVAKVILEDKGQTIREQDIIRYCNQHMSNYKVPRKIEFVESFPTSRYGKKVRKLQV